MRERQKCAVRPAALAVPARPGFGDLPVSCADSGMPAGMKAITGARRVGGKAEVTPNAEQLTPSKLLMATYCSYVEC
jgi:hypothetical protein